MTDVPSGRPHPYDLPLQTCQACTGRGSVAREAVRSMFDGGGVETRQEQCRACKGRGKRYVSHYETCPNADEFRTKKVGR